MIHRIPAFPVRHTIWWGHVRDIGIVRCLASEKTDTRRAADGDSAIVSSVKRSLVCYVLLDQGHIVHRRQVQVLIIRNDEDEVGLAGRIRAIARARAHRRARTGTEAGNSTEPQVQSL